MSSWLHTEDGRPIFCAARVYRGGYSSSKCRRVATTYGEADSPSEMGKPLCSTHDPVKIAQRQAKRTQEQHDAYQRKQEYHASTKASYAKQVVSCVNAKDAAELVERIIGTGTAWGRWR